MAASTLFSQSQATSSRYFLVTKANAALPNGPCRALLCGTAGSIELMDLEGNIATDVPLQAGYNQLACAQVRTGGASTAGNIWALY